MQHIDRFHKRYHLGYQIYFLLNQLKYKDEFLHLRLDLHVKKLALFCLDVLQPFEDGLVLHKTLR